jgi:molecular chaperone HscB
VNYFEWYQIRPAFQIDLPALKKRYYALSRELHPDFHTQASAEQQDEMLQRASLNNEAFKTLSDPDLRMRYVLELYGLLGDENAAPALPQAFLMDMMEINEALMELEFEPDAGKAEVLKNNVQVIENQIFEEVLPLLEQVPETDWPEADLKKVRDYYLKKRYLLRIQENLRTFAASSEN